MKTHKAEMLILLQRKLVGLFGGHVFVGIFGIFFFRPVWVWIAGILLITFVLVVVLGVAIVVVKFLW